MPTQEVKLSPSGRFMTITTGLTLVDGGDLPDADAVLSGQLNSQVLFTNGTLLTAPRSYTVQAGTAAEGDRLTILVRNLPQPIVILGVPGSGGFLFPASTGMQSLELEFSGGNWVAVGGGTDTQSAAAPGPYFALFSADSIPGNPAGEPGGQWDVGFASQILVENDYRWCVDINIHMLVTVDSELDFELQLDDGGGGRTVIASWSEFVGPETVAYSKVMQVLTTSSGGVGDGLYDLYLVVTGNGSGVAIAYDFPSNMMAHRWDQAPS